MRGDNPSSWIGHAVKGIALLGVITLFIWGVYERRERKASRLRVQQKNDARAAHERRREMCTRLILASNKTTKMALSRLAAPPQTGKEASDAALAISESTKPQASDLELQADAFLKGHFRTLAERAIDCAGMNRIAGTDTVRPSIYEQVILKQTDGYRERSFAELSRLQLKLSDACEPCLRFVVAQIAEYCRDKVFEATPPDISKSTPQAILDFQIYPSAAGHLDKLKQMGWPDRATKWCFGF